MAKTQPLGSASELRVGGARDRDLSGVRDAALEALEGHRSVDEVLGLLAARLGCTVALLIHSPDGPQAPAAVAAAYGLSGPSRALRLPAVAELVAAALPYPEIARTDGARCTAAVPADRNANGAWLVLGGAVTLDPATRAATEPIGQLLRAATERQRCQAPPAELNANGLPPSEERCREVSAQAPIDVFPSDRERDAAAEGAVDVAAQREAARRLTESEQRYKSLFELNPDATISVDGAGLLTNVNPACEGLFGYSAAEFFGTHFTRYVTSAHRAAAGTNFARVMAGESFTTETVGVHRDGREIPLQLAQTPIVVDGKIVGCYAVLKDITERKRAETEIASLTRDLERRVAERTAELAAANRELESFSYSVSHDLRAPLRSIDGFSEALLEDLGGRLGATATDYLRRIRAATQTMSQLIDGLLDLSRVARLELRHELVDLSALARSIADDLRRSQPERAVEFAIAATPPATGDARLLRVVLQNLLSNAWKFTGRHATARIEFDALERDGETVYFVRDDGAGFDMARAGKLFGAFQRLHAASEFEGTGIGLATVRRVVHRHEGRIWAEGASEHGATFYFTL